MSLRLRSLVQKAVDLAFAQASEILVEATFYKVTGYTFSLATGEEVAVVAEAEVSAIEAAYTVSESSNGNIQYGDRKLVVRASELAGVSPKPDAGDWFVIGDRRYDVRVANLDPTGTIWVFQTRSSRIVLTEDLTPDTAEDWNLVVNSAEDWGALVGVVTSEEDWLR